MHACTAITVVNVYLLLAFTCRHRGRADGVNGVEEEEDGGAETASGGQ